MFFYPNKVGLLEGYDDSDKEDKLNIKSHDGAVISVLYNPLFNQVKYFKIFTIQ